MGIYAQNGEMEGNTLQRSMYWVQIQWQNVTDWIGKTTEIWRQDQREGLPTLDSWVGKNTEFWSQKGID